MLTYKTTATAPGGEADVNQIIVLHIPIQGTMRNHRHEGSHGNTGKEKEEGRRERLNESESYVSSSEPRPRLK